MRRRRNHISDDENADRWLLTYADMITLLLAFFVVMYSMSQVDAKKFGRMAEALNGVLRGGESILNTYDKPHLDDGHGLLKLGNLRMIQTRFRKQFEDLGKESDVETEITERGLVVHIVESALFGQGSAILKPRATGILDLIAGQIQGIPNHIRVEGHTDDRSINTARFPSNWELSSARATEVVRYFTDNHGLQPNRASALGYGKFRPVLPNNSIENRAKNRRVDVVILTMELSLKEPSSQLYSLTQNQQELPPSRENLSLAPTAGP